MALVTVYCVQPFWRAAPTKLARGDLRQFADEDAAMRAGKAAARRNAGAIIYRVEGDPEFEDWGRPVLVASLGEVPDIGF